MCALTKLNLILRSESIQACKERCFSSGLISLDPFIKTNFSQLLSRNCASKDAYTPYVCTHFCLSWIAGSLPASLFFILYTQSNTRRKCWRAFHLKTEKQLVKHISAGGVYSHT